MKIRRTINLSVGWATFDQAEAPVRIGDRAIPAVIEVVLPGVDGQPRLEMTIDSSDGVPRCVDLTITRVDGGREVRTTDTRAVAIEDWIEAIVSATADRIEDRDDGTVTIISSSKSDVEIREAVSLIRTARRADRRTMNDELLARVAEVYTAQASKGVEAVQAAFGTSYRTAARYVKGARDEGLIPGRETDDGQ